LLICIRALPRRRKSGSARSGPAGAAEFSSLDGRDHFSQGAGIHQPEMETLFRIGELGGVLCACGLAKAFPRTWLGSLKLRESGGNFADLAWCSEDDARIQSDWPGLPGMARQTKAGLRLKIGAAEARLACSYISFLRRFVRAAKSQLFAKPSRDVLASSEQNAKRSPFGRHHRCRDASRT
jgi:hypothetical protein